MILDFSSQMQFLVALLPEAVLTAVALLILLVDVYQRRNRSEPSRPIVRWIAVGGVVAAMVANAYLLNVETAPFPGMIAVDAFSVAVNFILLAATGLALLFSFDYLDREGLNIGEFYFLILSATVGMMVMVASRDLIPFFVAVELMSISVYVLTGMNRRDPRSAEAALKYFLMGAFASAFLLYGIALLFGATGSTNMALVASEVARGTQDGNLLLIGGVLLFIVGLAFKVSAVPFHMWTPDAYQGAPTPVTGFMAAAVKTAGFAAIVRIVTIELAPAAPIWESVLWWLAMLTMIVANFLALAQDDVKRLLAYSSIAHAGYLLVGVVAANELGRSATLFYLAVYAVMTLGSFAIVYVVAGDGDHRTRLSDYRGLGWQRPVLAAALVLFLLSLAGFPPTAGFVAKLYILMAAVEAGRIELAITLALTSFVSYYYYLRIIWKMYFEEPSDDVVRVRAPGLAFRIAATLAVIAILAAGLFPGRALETSSRVGASLQPRQVIPAEMPAIPVTPIDRSDSRPRPSSD